MILGGIVWGDFLGGVFSFFFRRWKNKTAKTRNCLTKFSNYLDSERCRPCCPDGACQKRFSWFSDWSQKVQKFANIVDLLKSFPTSIYLRKSASIQPRTGLPKVSQKLAKTVRTHIGDAAAPAVPAREVEFLVEPLDHDLDYSCLKLPNVAESGRFKAERSC